MKTIALISWIVSIGICVIAHMSAPFITVEELLARDDITPWQVTIIDGRVEW